MMTQTVAPRAKDAWNDAWMIHLSAAMMHTKMNKTAKNLIEESLLNAA